MKADARSLPLSAAPTVGYHVGRLMQVANDYGHDTDSLNAARRFQSIVREIQVDAARASTPTYGGDPEGEALAREFVESISRVSTPDPGEGPLYLGCGCLDGTHEPTVAAMKVAHPDLIVPDFPPGFHFFPAARASTPETADRATAEPTCCELACYEDPGCACDGCASTPHVHSWEPNTTLDGWRCEDETCGAKPARASTPDTLATVVAALTSEDEIAHGEAWSETRGGLGSCAYCASCEWPCRTQQSIDRLLALLAAPPDCGDGGCAARASTPDTLREAVGALLTELSESPLPGARYARDVVARRMSVYLAQPTPYVTLRNLGEEPDGE